MANKENFFKKAFRDMAENAKAQHEVDKMNLAAAKAEAKATFNENRSSVTFQKAKQESKQIWRDAKMKPSARRQKMKEDQLKQIEIANERIEKANDRIIKTKNK